MTIETLTISQNIIILELNRLQTNIYYVTQSLFALLSKLYQNID